MLDSMGEGGGGNRICLVSHSLAVFEDASIRLLMLSKLSVSVAVGY